jgi:hypothetical protein
MAAGPWLGQPQGDVSPLPPLLAGSKSGSNHNEQEREPLLLHCYRRAIFPKHINCINIAAPLRRCQLPCKRNIELAQYFSLSLYRYEVFPTPTCRTLKLLSVRFE